MSKLYILEYIIKETARVAADYNFYWNIGNTKDGIEITFTTANYYWSNTIIITNKDVNGLSEEDWQKIITILIEKNAESLDNSEADYLAKKMCQEKESFGFVI